MKRKGMLKGFQAQAH